MANSSQSWTAGEAPKDLQNLIAKSKSKFLSVETQVVGNNLENVENSARRVQFQGPYVGGGGDDEQVQTMPGCPFCSLTSGCYCLGASQFILGSLHLAFLIWARGTDGGVDDAKEIVSANYIGTLNDYTFVASVSIAAVRGVLMATYFFATICSMNDSHLRICAVLEILSCLVVLFEYNVPFASVRFTTEGLVVAVAFTTFDMILKGFAGFCLIKLWETVQHNNEHFFGC